MAKSFKPYSQQVKEIRKDDREKKEKRDSSSVAIKVLPKAASETLRCLFGSEGGGYRH